MKLFLIYILVINLVGFLLMFVDKQKAIKNKWRISEMTFLILSFMGAGIGLLLGMYTFRHKTKKWYFKFGFVFVLLIQFYLLWYFFGR